MLTSWMTSGSIAFRVSRVADSPMPKAVTLPPLALISATVALISVGLYFVFGVLV
jgi:hypothetical protein